MLTNEAINEIIDLIISSFSLEQRCILANAPFSVINSCDFTFEDHIKDIAGIGMEDEEFSIILKGIWQKLRDTHRLKVVKEDLK